MAKRSFLKLLGLRQQGIRWRLALLYSGIFAIGLSVFCAVLFQYFQRTQQEAFDATLYNYAVDISSNLEMDFIGRLFVVNPNVSDAYKQFPFQLGSSFFEFRDSTGRVLRNSPSLGTKTLPFNAEMLRAVVRDKAILQTVSSDKLGLRSASGDLRLLTYWAQHADWREPLILQIAVPMDLPRQEQRDLLLFFMLAIPSFLVVCGLAGVWMSKRALKPVHDITLKAQLITGVEKLKERIPVPEAHDEIHELAVTFNSLLTRLDKAFTSQDRFISNASHQLKTPLTILKGELEILRKSHTSQSMADGLDSAAGEINRLIQLVQDLLLLARLEAGRDTIALYPVRLDEVMIQVVSRLQKLASNKQIQIATKISAVDGASEMESEVRGDEDLLESMLENFVENAIKYSPPRSIIELEMLMGLGNVRILVKDNGPGIPTELRSKIFERFSRGEPSHIIPGSGLGLSIASEIANIHGVQIEIKDRDGLPGTVIALTFRRRGQVAT